MIDILCIWRIVWLTDDLEGFRCSRCGYESVEPIVRICNEQCMSFNEFLLFVRQNIGKKGGLIYWLRTYKRMSDHSVKFIKKELPFLAVHAVANDWAERLGPNGHNTDD